MDLVSRWQRLQASSLRLFAGDDFVRLPDDSPDLVLCAGFTHTMRGEKLVEPLSRLAGVTAPVVVWRSTLSYAGTGPRCVHLRRADAALRPGRCHHGEEDYRHWLASAGYQPIETIDLGDRRTADVVT